MARRLTFTGFWVACMALLACGGAHAEVSIEVKPYGGWPNCLWLTNGDVELVVTTDIGPRVMRYGTPDGQNFMKEYADQLGETGGDEWRIYGGHRLWHAPEAMPRTYALDNSPIDYEIGDGAVTLLQPVEPETGVRKEIEIAMAASGTEVSLTHTLINENLWDITLSPWTLTVMAPGGRMIAPQEEYRAHPEYLLPARPLVLWHYTDMQDERVRWGTQFITLEQDPEADTKFKIGLMNTLGWTAYTLGEQVFVKRYPFEPGGAYPDYGCNFETFTDGDMLEVESLGPLTALEAGGGAVSHVEHWYVFDATIGESEDAIERDLLPLVEQTRAVE